MLECRPDLQIAGSAGAGLIQTRYPLKSHDVRKLRLCASCKSLASMDDLIEVAGELLDGHCAYARLGDEGVLALPQEQQGKLRVSQIGVPLMKQILAQREERAASPPREAKAVAGQLLGPVVRAAVFSFPVDFSADTQVVRDALERLTRRCERAVAAHAPNTARAWKTDWEAFIGFCEAHRLSPFPTSPETVCRFIEQRALTNKPATLRRLKSSIAKVHQLAGLPDPCKDEDVSLALTAATRGRGAQDQARPMIWDELARFFLIPPRSLRDIRDRAMAAVGYDGMCRPSELVGFEVGDFSFPARGAASVYFRTSKTDQSGEGAYAYLAGSTVRLVQAWLEATKIDSGPVFRHIRGKQKLGEPLNPEAVTHTLRRIALKIGLSGSDHQETSGHSLRVGATQDLLAQGANTASVANAGRWKSETMVIRYDRRRAVGRGAMAQLARAQGRE